jgi:hypothetical protein
VNFIIEASNRFADFIVCVYPLGHMRGASAARAIVVIRRSRDSFAFRTDMADSAWCERRRIPWQEVTTLGRKRASSGFPACASLGFVIAEKILNYRTRGKPEQCPSQYQF